MPISETTVRFAKEFVSTMRTRMGDDKPPGANGSRENWTCEVKSVLREMGTKRGYQGYPWLLDYIWWSMKDQRMMLAAESEFGNLDEIETDFEKLPVFKCLLKLLVFSGDDRKTEQAKKKAEEYLQMFGEHVSGEEYLLIAFTDSGTSCFCFKVPEGGGGHLKKEDVKFTPVKVAKPVSQAASAA